MSKPKAKDFKFLIHVQHFQPYWYKTARQATHLPKQQLKLDGIFCVCVLIIGKETSNKILINIQE